MVRDRQTETETDRRTGTETDSDFRWLGRDRQTDRQRDRETETDRDRQTDRDRGHQTNYLYWINIFTIYLQTVW